VEGILLSGWQPLKTQKQASHWVGTYIKSLMESVQLTIMKTGLHLPLGEVAALNSPPIRNEIWMAPASPFFVRKV
jgi:ADP-dependent phosphofructokinase/glucokinase